MPNIRMMTMSKVVLCIAGSIGTFKLSTLIDKESSWLQDMWCCTVQRMQGLVILTLATYRHQP